MDSIRDQKNFSVEDNDESKVQEIIETVNGLIDGYKIDHNIENIKDLTQQEFCGLLMFISVTYFKPTKILYKYSQGINNNNNVTCLYNDYIVYKICEYYIYLCMVNNKVCNIYGFCLFTGVDDDTLKSWGKQESQRPQAFATYKRLMNCYENSLENGSQSGRNPVGYIATLNHRFGWQAENKPQLTVNITRTQQEIMSTLDTALIDEIGKNTDKP